MSEMDKSDTAHADQFDGAKFVSHRPMHQTVTDETTVREKTTDQSETKELSLCTNTFFNCANGNSVQVRFLTVCQRLGSDDEISTVSVSPLTDVSAALSRGRKFVALRALRCQIFCPQQWGIFHQD